MIETPRPIGTPAGRGLLRTLLHCRRLLAPTVDSTFASASALPPCRAQGLQLLPLIGRELRLGRLVGANAGDGPIGLEPLDLADLGLDLSHVDRLGPQQTEEVELGELRVGLLLDGRPPRIHAQLLERAHLLRRQPQLLLVPERHENDGAATPHVAVTSVLLTPTPSPFTLHTGSTPVGST